VIDGLFGSGLNKALSGGFAAVVKYINASPATVVSIDIPSGLMGEDNTYNVHTNIVRAHLTLSLQLPKLAFLFAENEPYVGEWQLLDIGLSEDAIHDMETDFCLLEHEDVSALLKPRSRFAHKGNFGRALLIAGSQGMAGASVLAARACLRSGVGLLTVHVPFCNNFIVQTSVPEALNLLGEKRNYIGRLPKGSILTPHPKELERLVGKCQNSYERLMKARELAKSAGVHIILKGAYSAIVTPAGKCFFNPTGNPGMATGGSGDVLTGVVLALLAQGYEPEKAACLATYVHGLAGDIACKKQGAVGMTAGDMTACLPLAWKMLEE